MNRLLLIAIFFTATATSRDLIATETSVQAKQPNIVVIFCDDLGYGDLGCFGHPTIATPNLDRMAAEGQKWTEFYVAACVCTPSRAALQTGRYPIRNGMCSDKRRVLFPDSQGGLPAREVTIGRMLQQHGYATHAVGKWHLGHLPQYLPTSHGYDSYFGIPYSNDMDAGKHTPKGRARFNNPKTEYFNVPLMRGEEIVERPADQHTITKRFTEEAVKLIRNHGDKPFFIYLAHNLPHVPLFVSKDFTDVSRRGLYGDVIEEIDWSVGQVLNALREEKLDEDTLVVFTSDNGPWKTFKQQGGSAGLLRDGKGSTWEGGMREPTIFWWPKKIKPAVVMAPGSTLDLLPTFAAVTGAARPTDRTLDGFDLSPVLFEGKKSPRENMFYYHGEECFAVRMGQYKAHFKTKTSYVGQKAAKVHDPPLLYHLGHDPSEEYDIAKDHPDVIDAIRKLKAEHEASIEPCENQLTRKTAAVSKQMDLLIVAGQSNAVGFNARPSDLPADAADKEILFWWKCGDPPPDQHDTHSNQTWTHLQPQPLGDPITPRTGRQYGNFGQPEGGFGPEIGLARTLIAKERTPLAVLKVAFSGTGMRTDWNHADPGDSGACYRALLSEFKAAIAAAKRNGIELKPRALVWVQGESDANAEDGPKYAHRLGSMIGQLRTDINAPEMQALIAVNTQFSQGTNKFMPMIVEQQRLLAKRDPLCHYVDTSKATIANSAHYDSAGTLAVGRMFAERLLSLTP